MISLTRQKMKPPMLPALLGCSHDALSPADQASWIKALHRITKSEATWPATSTGRLGLRRATLKKKMLAVDVGHGLKLWVFPVQHEGPGDHGSVEM